MDVLTGPFTAVAVVLVAAGVLKVRSPAPTCRALTAVGVRAPAPVVRLLGILEVTVGTGALVVGGRWPAVLVAAAYLSFAGFVVLAMSRRVELTSCGCFGKSDTPPTAVHVTVNLACAAVAAAATAGSVPGLADVLADQPLAGAPFVLLTVITAYLLYLALALLPKTARAARQVRV